MKNTKNRPIRRDVTKGTIPESSNNLTDAVVDKFQERKHKKEFEEEKDCFTNQNIALVCLVSKLPKIIKVSFSSQSPRLPK